MAPERPDRGISCARDARLSRCAVEWQCAGRIEDDATRNVLRLRATTSSHIVRGAAGDRGASYRDLQFLISAVRRIAVLDPADPPAGILFHHRGVSLLHGCTLNAGQGPSYASTSSASSVTAAPLPLRAETSSLARSASSSSFATLGLSLKYWRAFSLPCPTRSPP